MRPAGEVHLAVLQAAHALRLERAASGQGPTLAELVARSCVGYKVARDTVANLKRHGHLKIVGTRRVPGRNRLAAEYAPTSTLPVQPAPAEQPAWADLGTCLQAWTR